MAATQDAAIELNARLVVTSWNAAAELLYGLPASAVLGRPFADVVSCKRDSPARESLHPLTLVSIGLTNGPATHVVPGGRELAVTVTVIPLHFRGHSEHYLVLVRDDSEYLRQAALLEERLKFETLLADLSIRFSRLTEDEVDGEIERWLWRLVEILDVDRSSFAELTPGGQFNVTHTCCVPGVEPPHKGIADQRLPWLTQQFANRRAVVLAKIPDDLPEEAVDERQHFVAVGMRAGIGIPVCIAGSVVCVLTFGAFRRSRTWDAEVISRLYLVGDVIANAIHRRNGKQQLEQKQHELAHVARVAAMGELASVIAHELDQPLTAVVSNAEAVRHLLKSDSPDFVEADEALSDVIESAMRVSTIVQRERRLLRKSRLEFETLDLNDVVSEIEPFIRGEARRAGAVVQFELAVNLPPLIGDRVQLQQVVLNLARNGVQAMRDEPMGGRDLIIRSALASDGEVKLTVTDAGPTVDPERFERMFEPFYTTKPKGLGMGLAISRSILDAHHGRIWATRNAERGITMHIAIPGGK
jgi:signal transduction histidine kinase/PAS domain-containing protein